MTNIGPFALIGFIEEGGENTCTSRWHRKVLRFPASGSRNDHFEVRVKAIFDRFHVPAINGMFDFLGEGEFFSFSAHDGLYKDREINGRAAV